MSVAVSKLEKYSIGPRWEVEGELALSGTYATGGYEIKPATLGLGQITQFLSLFAGGYCFTYNHVTNKLMAYWAKYDEVAAGVLVEVTNGTAIGISGLKFTARGL